MSFTEYLKKKYVLSLFKYWENIILTNDLSMLSPISNKYLRLGLFYRFLAWGLELIKGCAEKELEPKHLVVTERFNVNFSYFAVRVSLHSQK